MAPPVSRRRIEAAIAVLSELTDQPELGGDTLGDVMVVMEALGRISERAKVVELAAARQRREQRERARGEARRQASQASQAGRQVTQLRPAVGGEFALRQAPTRALAAAATAAWSSPPAAPRSEAPVRVQVTVTASPAAARQSADAPGSSLATMPAAAVAVRLGPPAVQRQLWPARAAWGLLAAALLLLAVVVLGGTLGHVTTFAGALPVAAAVAVAATSGRHRGARRWRTAPTP